MRIIIVAGDRSGDEHAARLVACMRNFIPDLEVFGLGGPMLSAEGMQSLAPFEKLNISGFWEVARHYRFFRKVFQETSTLLRRLRPDVLIPVDYPGFNIPLSEHARYLGIRVFWYIAPQFWAWGRWRMGRFAKAVERVFVILPFEVEFFSKWGIVAEFYGHPLLDDPNFSDVVTQRDEKTVALLPGSRSHECERHLPLMLEVADHLTRRDRSIECVLALPQMQNDTGGLRICANTRALLRRAAVGLVKAGTSTLEAALLGLPFIAMYRTSLPSYFIARALLDIPYVALPNIILNRQCVEEILQFKATPSRLADHLYRLLTDAHLRHKQQRDFAQLHSILGGGGSSERTAARIVQLLNST